MQMLIVSTLVAITFSTPLPLNPVGAPSVLAEVSGDEPFDYKLSDDNMICPAGWDNVDADTCVTAAGHIGDQWKEDGSGYFWSRGFSEKESRPWREKASYRSTEKEHRPKWCFAKQSGSDPKKKKLWFNKWGMDDGKEPSPEKQTPSDGVRYAVCQGHFEKLEKCKNWADDHCQATNSKNEDATTLDVGTCCQVCEQPEDRSGKKYRDGINQDIQCTDCENECYEADDACGNQPLYNRTVCLRESCRWTGSSCQDPMPITQGAQ